MKSLSNTVIIYQKPDLYFFPLLGESVFPPFGIPERSFRYLLYKALYLLHIPACSVFWGDWKRHIAAAKDVIIFDYGYQRGMETYIKKVNPDCRVYLFLWNKIDRFHHNHLLYSDKDAVYSTDPGDCERYHLRYNHIFYPLALHRPYAQPAEEKLFFLGSDKGRGGLLLALKERLERCGLPCDIRITGSAPKGASAPLCALYTPASLDYPQYLQECESCSVLLDVPQTGQRALTMRVLEAVFLSKKLITTNPEIRDCEFYDPSNILILQEDLTEITPKRLTAFLSAPFVPYRAESLERLGVSDWLNRFLP